MTWKDKWAKFKDGAKYQEISAHIEKNKNTYIAGAGGAVCGALTILILRGHPAPTLINNTVSPTIAPVFNNENAVNLGGYMRKIVQCVEHPDRIWGSVTEAALANGDSLHSMSRHLNGHEPNYNGLKYQVIGIGTTS